MARLVISRELFEYCGGHLSSRAEQVGFFLAEVQTEERTFLLREWRPVPLEGLEHQSDVHVSLTDEMRGEVIKWAWESGLSLVEAHSHGSCAPAALSPSDLWGLDDWVPHLWWRLGGRPYAALVTADNTFDAIAWIVDSRTPEQVDALVVTNNELIRATGRTLLEDAGGRGDAGSGDSSGT